MENKSSRIQEMREKSRQGQNGHKLISNGRPLDNEQLFDYPRKPDQLASFDEECWKIKNIADQLASATIEASVTMGNLIQEHISIQKHKNKDIIVNQPPNSAETSLNKITIDEILRSITQNHQEKSKKNYENFEMNMQHFQTGAKAFVDRIFLDRKFTERRSEHKPFSDALEILNTNKDLFMNFLPEPNFKRFVKNLHPSQKEKERVNPILDSKFLEKIDYTGRYSSKTGFATPSDKIVILDPAAGTSGRFSKAKPAAFFSFREMKRKLKHTFEGIRKEPNDHFLMDGRSHKLSNTGSFLICRGLDTSNSFASSNNAKIKENPCKKPNHKSRNGDGNSCSSVRLSNKQEFNVILEAKRHLSARVKMVNSVEIVTANRPPKTLARIISSPEHKEGGSVMHPMVGPLSQNETFSPTVDDFPSIYQFDINKFQEDHRSPVSILEPFFTEDSHSPRSTKFQTDEQQLQPLRIDFEECSSDSINPAKEEQDYISNYVGLVFEASCLDWEQLTKIRTRPEEELLNPSLFDEVEFVPTDTHFDPMILFDHMNEILQEIYQCHFVKPRIMCAPLQELVLDEIMKESEFYLLPRTEKRTTLNQIVEKDVAGSRSWLDLRIDTEQIVIHVSDDVLEESIMDILYEFYTRRCYGKRSNK